jgi:thioredoxin reductase
VKTYVKSSVEEITDSAVSLVSRKGEHTELPADTVIMSVGLRPDTSQVKSLLAACPESYAIGDCSSPARILEAVNEGDRVARRL